MDAIQAYFEDVLNTQEGFNNCFSIVDDMSSFQHW